MALENRVVTLTILTKEQGADETAQKISNVGSRYDDLSQRVAAYQAKQDALAQAQAKIVSGLGTFGGHLDSITQKLDLGAKVIGGFGGALDAIGWVPASTAAAQFSGRLTEISDIAGIASGGVNYLTQALDTHTEAVDKTTKSYQDLTDAKEAANSNSESSSWVTDAVAIGAVVAATGALVYGVYKANQAMQAGLDAVDSWVEHLVAGGLESRFTDPAIAAAKATQDLSRELGVGAAAFSTIGAVARDFGVGQDAATAAAKRMVDVLDQTDTATAGARQVLEDYIGSVKGLTGDQWATALDRFAQALNGVRDSGQKTRDVVAVLGSDGMKWLSGIANQTGQVSHQFTEADRIIAVVQQNIAASQARIAKGPDPTWWDGVKERLDAMISSSDEFKAKQEYAASELVNAWNEYKAGIGGIADLWNGARKAASDYYDLLAGKLTVPQQSDGRPPAPTTYIPSDNRTHVLGEDYVTPGITPAEQRAFNARSAAGVGADTFVQDAEKALQELQAKEENWFTWSDTRTAEYWQDQRKQYLANVDQMSPAQLANSPVLQGIDQKIADAQKGAAAPIKATSDAMADLNTRMSQQLADSSSLAQAWSEGTSAGLTMEAQIKALSAARGIDKTATVTQAQVNDQLLTSYNAAATGIEQYLARLDQANAAKKAMADASAQGPEAEQMAQLTAQADAQVADAQKLAQAYYDQTGDASQLVDIEMKRQDILDKLIQGHSLDLTKALNDELNTQADQIKAAQAQLGYGGKRLQQSKEQVAVEQEIAKLKGMGVTDLNSEQAQKAIANAQDLAAIQAQADTQQKALDNYTHYLQHTASQWTSSLASAFSQAWQQGTSTWDALLKTMHAGFRTFLANLAAEAATTPLVQPIVADIAAQERE